MMSLGKWLLAFWSSLAEWFPWRQRQKPTGAVKSKTYLVNDYHFPGNTPHKSQRNKLYADQHQKAKHNRRRKPKKAIRNLYHLK